MTYEQFKNRLEFWVKEANNDTLKNLMTQLLNDFNKLPKLDKYTCKVHGEMPHTQVTIVRGCKLCRCTRSTEYRKKYPEKIKAYDKKRWHLRKKPKPYEE